MKSPILASLVFTVLGCSAPPTVESLKEQASQVSVEEQLAFLQQLDVDLIQSALGSIESQSPRDYLSIESKKLKPIEVVVDPGIFWDTKETIGYMWEGVVINHAAIVDFNDVVINLHYKAGNGSDIKVEERNIHILANSCRESEFEIRIDRPDQFSRISWNIVSATPIW